MNPNKIIPKEIISKEIISNEIISNEIIPKEKHFDMLLDYCTKLNESTSEKCLVCHIPIEKNDIHIKLVCKHIYHPDCISYKSGKVKCLYCEQLSLPEIINNNIINNINKCTVIMKSGKNKGKPCERVNCHYHKL